MNLNHMYDDLITEYQRSNAKKSINGFIQSKKY